MNVAQDVIVRIQGLNKTFRGRAGTVVALNGIDLISIAARFSALSVFRAQASPHWYAVSTFWRSPPRHGNGGWTGAWKAEQKQLLEARRSMGMIFQQFNLLQQRTALQNICFPLEIAGTSKADAETGA